MHRHQSAMNTTLVFTSLPVCSSLADAWNSEAPNVNLTAICTIWAGQPWLGLLCPAPWLLLCAWHWHQCVYQHYCCMHILLFPRWIGILLWGTRCAGPPACMCKSRSQISSKFLLQAGKPVCHQQYKTYMHFVAAHLLAYAQQQTALTDLQISQWYGMNTNCW